MATTKEWTNGRLKAFIISALRNATRRYPPKYECLNEAKTEKKTNTKTGRLAQHYRCACCRFDFPATGVQVDHILPVVDPEVGFTTWDEYLSRLFCPKDNLQVLCIECHNAKSTLEKETKKCSSKRQLTPKKGKSPSKAKSRKKP